MKPIAKLHLTEVMDRHVFSVTPKSTLADMVERMKSEHVTHVVVLDGSKPVGILTERDLVRLLHQRVDRSRRVEEFMSTPVAIVSGSLGFRTAYVQLCLSRLRHLVIVDHDGAVIGVAAERDFLGHLGLELFQNVRSMRDLIDKTVPQVPPTLPVTDAIDRMVREKRGCVAVVENERLVGVFTEQQVPTVLARHEDGSPTMIGEVMNPRITPVTETVSIAEVMAQLVSDRIGHVVVVAPDNGAIVGTIAQSRLLENVRTAVYAEMATRQLMEDQLHHVEAQLEATLEHTPNVAVQWYDRDGLVHYWNHASESIFGWTAAEAVGKSIDQLMFPADDLPKFRAMLAEIESSGRTFGPIEHQMRHRQGTPRWVESTLFPIPGDDSDESFVVSMDVDISSRKETELRLRDSESNLNTFFDTVDDFLFVLDAKGDILRVNTVVTERLGYRKDDLIGKNVLSVHPAERRDEAARIVGDMLNAKSAYCPVPLQTADGRLIPVETRVVHGQWNGAPALFGVSRDVGKQIEMLRQLENESENRRQLLEEASEREFFWQESQQVGQLGGWRADPINNTVMWTVGVYEIVEMPLDFKPDLATALDAYLPESRAQVIENLQRTLATGEPFNIQIQVRGAQSGRVKWAELRGHPHRDTGGRIDYVMGTLQDITERKQAEEALRHASIYTRSLIEASLDPLVTISPDGKITDVNEAAERVTGKSRLELIGSDFSNYFTEPDKARTVYQKVFSEGRVKDYPLSIRHRHDSITEVLYNASLYRDNAGKVEGVFAAARDVTERNRAERQLATYQQHLEEMVEKRTAELMQTEEKARIILNSSADGLYGVDPHGIITFINPAGCALLGYRAEDVIGQSAHALFHHARPDGQPYPEAECHAHAALKVGEMRRIDNEVYWRADGQALPVMYAIHPILQDGRVSGAVTSFVDMSEQRAAADARERALLAAENLARVRREFLANMSHELRTPLNGVLGFADIGMRHYQNPERVRDALEKIKLTGNRLLGVINDVLDFSRIEAGKLHIELLPVPLHEHILQTVEIVHKKALAKHLALKVDCSPDLPVTCISDPLRFGQVLLNLLSNAVKFTEKGEVVLKASLADNELVFVIRDTGIGMTQEQIGMLFNPFQQADSSSTRQFGGTGLGLVITKRILELMGGKIRVESTFGMGTTFEFRLPYLPPSTVPMASQVAKPALPPKPLSGIAILVAEDEPINQAIMTENLTEDGADVTLVPNGQEAVDQVVRDGNRYDIVLMDIQMPVMGGLEATGLILQHYPDLPIIGQTAHAMAEERDRCLASGMVAHITKPIDPDALVRLILQHVSAAGSQGLTR